VLLPWVGRNWSTSTLVFGRVPARNELKGSRTGEHPAFPLCPTPRAVEKNRQKLVIASKHNEYIFHGDHPGKSFQPLFSLMLLEGRRARRDVTGHMVFFSHQ